ncbi:MAG: peptidylprolyl isomerase [Pseudolabrys sp.]
MKRIAVVACLVLLGLSLAGCTKCGWLWNEGPRGCHSDAPRT